MSDSSVGNASGTLNDVSAAPVDVICEPTVATSCGI